MSMNKREKIVQDAFLNNEEAVIRRLKSVYNQALKDIEAKAKALQDQINGLEALQGMTSDPAELAKLKSMEQSKVYQKQYQDALKKQISSVLDNMQVEEFKTVSEYLQKCYEDGFIGAMYDLQGQGIPLCFPMDQESMVRAVQLDSKIKEDLYTRLGEDVTLLKRKITAQVSRGIATGMMWSQVANQLAGYTKIGYNNAVRIARTEGHRIQVQSAMDACYKAAEKGANVVKQWDSTLDGRTRPSHQKVDGEIRELDEPFSNKLMFPGDPNGKAAEVINCRCALLQRARWALDEAELETLKERAAYFGLDKTENFDDFKKKYLKAVEKSASGDILKAKKPSENAVIENVGGVDCWVEELASYNFTDGTANGVKKTAPAKVYTTPDGTRFVYPKKYNKKNQTLSPELAIETWCKVPGNIRTKIQKTVEVVDYYNPMDSYWKKKYKNFGHSYATGGEQITMYRSDYHEVDYLIHTFCHEGGHYIDYHLPGTDISNRYCMQSAWQNAMDKDFATSGKKSWRAYGENSPLEDFADSVGYFTMDCDAFVTTFPERAKLLEEILK